MAKTSYKYEVWMMDPDGDASDDADRINADGYPEYLMDDFPTYEEALKYANELSAPDYDDEPELRDYIIMRFKQMGMPNPYASNYVDETITIEQVKIKG